MTPLFRHFEAFPAPLRVALLSLTYTAMLAAILLFEAPANEAIIYIDVQ